MILEGSSDIVRAHRSIDLNGELASLVELIDGKCLVICHNLIALYKNATSVTDELGNGLINQVEISPGIEPDMNTGYVREFQAGYIGLTDGKAILIMPNYVQVFANKTDALNNKDSLAKINLS